VKHGDLTLNFWAVFKVNIIGCDLSISVELVKEKTASKCGKLRLINVDSKCLQGSWVTTDYRKNR
jgi:hypothetical protein